MGKNSKGKECGKGICQRKDGFYYARFVDKYGKRHEKYVPTRPEARNWLEEARFADTHDNIFVPSDMTVDAWFEFWQENMIADLVPNTRRNYRERYVHNIQPVIGGMLLSNARVLLTVKVRFSQSIASHVNPISSPVRNPVSNISARQFVKHILRWGPCSNQH